MNTLEPPLGKQKVISQYELQGDGMETCQAWCFQVASNKVKIMLLRSSEETNRACYVVLAPVLVTSACYEKHR